MIADYKAQGYRLANLSSGGEGIGRKAVPTEEFREKMRQLVMGEKNPNYHHFWTDEQKEHLSTLRKEAGIAKMEKNPRAKKVMCVETGKIYGCQQEAADDLGMKSMASIHHALKEKRFVVKGYHFVCGDDIERLDTEEKRQAYLSSLQS